MLKLLPLVGGGMKRWPLTDSSGVSSIQPLNADKGIPVDLLPKIDTLE